MNFSFWPCNRDSVYLTVHFIMYSLYLVALVICLLFSESNVCPSNEVNSMHEEVNLKITQKCYLNILQPQVI